jgi:hypothetical protein
MESAPKDRRSSLLSLGVSCVVVAVLGPLLSLLGTAPATLTGHDDSMTKYESLREHVRRDGPDDVVAIGSSVFRRGVIPGVVSRRMASLLRPARAPRVFNFGVPGHNVATYPMLVKLVIGVDRPQLLVLLVTPRAIDASARHLPEWAEIALGSPYGLALEDPLPVRGDLRRLLLDHWSFLTYAPTLRAGLLGEESEEPRERGVYDPNRGFAASPAREIGPRMRHHQGEIVREWETSPAFASALDRAVERARAAGARVLLVDAPLRAELLALMDDPERNVGGLRRFLEEASSRLGVQVAYAPPGLVPDDEFADLTHFLPVGAEKYSRWLGAEIARRYPDLRFD